jgi:hypothetical protein
MPDYIFSRGFFKHARSPTPLLVVAFLLITGLTASAMTWLTPASEALSSSLVAKVGAITPAPSQPPLTPQEGEQIAKVILLTVRPAGFEPAEVTLTADSYLVVIQNRGGLRGLTLRLDEEARGRLLEISLKARLDWRRRVNLPPGNYTITSTDHPEWVCHVKVTP